MKLIAEVRFTCKQIDKRRKKEIASNLYLHIYTEVFRLPHSYDADSK